MNHRSSFKIRETGCRLLHWPSDALWDHRAEGSLTPQSQVATTDLEELPRIDAHLCLRLARTSSSCLSHIPQTCPHKRLHPFRNFLSSQRPESNRNLPLFLLVFFLQKKFPNFSSYNSIKKPQKILIPIWRQIECRKWK